jgi:hypothetical protein
MRWLRAWREHREVLALLDDALGMGWRTRDSSPAGAVEAILRRCVQAQSARDRLAQRSP